MSDTHPFRVVAAIGFCVLLISGFWSPVAVTYEPTATERSPHTVDGLQSAASDINTRVDGDREVLSIPPNYYAMSDRHHPYTSRVWILVSPYYGQRYKIDETERYQRVQQNLTERFQTGRVQLVIMTPRTEHFIASMPQLHDAFRDHYCPVTPRPEPYAQYNVDIYRYTANASGCENQIQTAWT